MDNIQLSKLRKEYKRHTLSESSIDHNPFLQFKFWFEEAIIYENPEANAMALATVGIDNKPSVRMVLLKDFDNNGFVFYTNYQSKKSRQILQNPNAAILFFWQKLERQVRVEGEIIKVSAEASDAYFSERPDASKISAIISEQSQVIENRQFIEDLKNKAEKEYKNKAIKRPSTWGGYRLKPVLFEFWQGRPDRLHDRIQYRKVRNTWKIERLAP
jgi:pyridoxamine 5'-phosphate oxidase